MRRVLFFSLAGVLVGGCTADDATRPPGQPVLAKEASFSASAGSTEASGGALLDDALLRLVPALGSSGAPLGAPLRQLQSGARLDARLIAATQLQLAAVMAKLPADRIPDADALQLSLDALAALASK